MTDDTDTQDREPPGPDRAAAVELQHKPEPTLQEQLDALVVKQVEAKQAQVDANIADLEKLIADADKAQADYDKAWETLDHKQTQLHDDAKTLKAALTASLQEKGLSEAKVRAKVQDAITALATARTDLDTKTIAQATAVATAAASVEAEKAAKAKLDLWRTPVAGITARQKAAEKILEEIGTLRNGRATRSEAYWKLVLGGNPDVPGQSFANLLIAGQPEVLKPEDLRDRIRTVWKGFTEARSKRAADQLALESADAALKAADAAVKALEKALIKTITDSLAAQEAAPGAA
jgi:hypothetical protein